MHPAETMMQLAKEGKIDFFRRSWTADYPDAESNFACFYSQNGAPPNYTRFKNKEYDLLYESILKEPSAEKRIPIYKKMEQILLEEAPIVPIFYDQSIRVIHKKVKNLGQNSINHLDLRKVRIEK
jgi:peptide/nickel transport system substrate-binding protein